MKLTQPDGDTIYIDEPVGSIVNDYVDARLSQGLSLLNAIQNAIGYAHMMSIEDDFLVGPRRTAKPIGTSLIGSASSGRVSSREPENQRRPITFGTGASGRVGTDRLSTALSICCIPTCDGDPKRPHCSCCKGQRSRNPSAVATND